MSATNDYRGAKHYAFVFTVIPAGAWVMPGQGNPRLGPPGASTSPESEDCSIEVGSFCVKRKSQNLGNFFPNRLYLVVLFHHRTTTLPSLTLHILFAILDLRWNRRYLRTLVTGEYSADRFETHPSASRDRISARKFNLRVQKQRTSDGADNLRNSGLVRAKQRKTQIKNSLNSGTVCDRLPANDVYS
jgi:hypothetical protein